MSETKVVLCQRTECKSDRIYVLSLGFKVARSEWCETFKGKEFADGHFSLDAQDSVFKNKDGLDAVIKICLQCGQTQGVFPAADLKDRIEEE